MKDRILNLIWWSLFALFIGVFMTVGQKTVDKVWPDKPVEVNVSQLKNV